MTDNCVANDVNSIGLIDMDDAEDVSSAGVGGVGYSDKLTSQICLKADERNGRMAILTV